MVNPSFSTFSVLISSNFWPYMKNRDETSHTGAPLTQWMVIGTGNLELITPSIPGSQGSMVGVLPIELRPPQRSNGCLKVDMNSDILLQTAAIFFSNELLSKTGYWLGVHVCYVWFRLHGLPLAARSGRFKTFSPGLPTTEIFSPGVT